MKYITLVKRNKLEEEWWIYIDDSQYSAGEIYAIVSQY